MDNYSTTCFVAFATIVLLWCVGKLKNTSLNNSFTHGLYIADIAFSKGNFKDAIETLQSHVERSRILGSYSNFDAGVEQSIKQNINCELEIMNKREGGDWHFCNESLKFKDSLTSREIIL